MFARSITLFSLLSWLGMSVGSLINVVRQDAQRFGQLEKLDTNKKGAVVKSSNVEPFQFSWPLVEMTSNTKDQEVYVVTFPDTAPGPVLYLLDQNLQLQYTWDNTSFSYFDLQYSNLQSTLYGIYVSSTYGRVLSNFTMDQATNTISVDQLFTLPYMWYVNASSFHHPSCHYYALINYFPGHPESTLDQQLVVADFSQDRKVKEPEVTVNYITNTPGIVQFIGYSDVTRQLYFSGMKFNATTAVIGTINVETGVVQEILVEKSAIAVGPLVVDDQSQTLNFFVQTVDGKQWQLWSLSLFSSKLSDRFGKQKASLVREYETSDKLKVFAAASIGL